MSGSQQTEDVNSIVASSADDSGVGKRIVFKGVEDTAKGAVEKVVETTLAGRTYDARTATDLSETVSNRCAEALRNLQLPFKFVGTYRILWSVRLQRDCIRL